MASLLRMPEIAASATEAVLQGWSVDENGQFEGLQPLATVETEKALIEIEAEDSGTVLRHLVAPGDRLEGGMPIALLGEVGEQVTDLAGLLAELGAGLPPVTTESGAVVEPATSPDRTGSHGVAGRTFSSPLARRLARDANLAIEEIVGTGPQGRVLRRDVEAALAGQVQTRSSRRSTAASPAVVDGRGELTEVPHSRMRSAIARRLTESQQTTPHFYLRGSARVDKLLKVRAQLNQASPVRVSVNDLVIKGVARAHALVPRMNVVWTETAMRQYSSVDIAVAVATDNGLLTPVLRNVDNLPIAVIASATRDLADRTRAGEIRQEELEGGSITVTNLGMFGTEEFAAIINPPQSAILAVGAARKEPIVSKGRLKVGTVMRFTLSVDHRAVDGAQAAEWMRVFTSLIEEPVQVLA